jgi:5'-nucleotidase
MGIVERRRLGWLVTAGLCSILLLGVAVAPTASATVTSRRPPSLRILVTNDDGYNAPGIDALVQALRQLPNVSIEVSAPATNESGTSSTFTPGPRTATRLATLSGYPAYAVQVTPADSVTWALANLPRPQVVVSGTNDGQNLGTLVNVSGTVGAARTAARAGIPALAVSQGLGNPPAFALSAHDAAQWVQQHRQLFTVKVKHRAHVLLQNLNAPTCTTGSVRGEVTVPIAATSSQALATPDCTSTATHPPDDITAFNEGFATLSTLPLS